MTEPKKPVRLLERLAFAKVEMWAVLLLALAGLVGVSLYGWLLRESLSDPNASWASRAAVNLADLPAKAATLWQHGLALDEQGRLVQSSPRVFDFEGDTGAGFQQVDPDFEEDGLLLISAYHPEHQTALVYLLDLESGERLWEWLPDHDQIVEMTPSLKRAREAGRVPIGTNRRIDFQCRHPYLLENGNILSQGGINGVLFMMNPHGEILWTLDGQFHHTIERQADGNFLVHRSVDRPGGISGTVLEGLEVREDFYLVVSPDGEILDERSVLGILERGGYAGLYAGVGPWESDVLHTNDADPILADDPYVRKGDVMISCRNVSSVFLYRPSEDRIVWLQTGPWLNQHDIDYLGDGVFSIFDNHDVRRFGRPLLPPTTLRTFDAKTGKTTNPFGDIFRREKLHTLTEGLHRILANGDAFVEITNQNEILRLSPDQVRWRYVHRTGPGQIGALHWARYFERDELDLSWIGQQRIGHETNP
ncbi:MAG: arylsulfotransferase family protein [Verrucomicrobiota bacterium]